MSDYSEKITARLIDDWGRDSPVFSVYSCLLRTLTPSTMQAVTPAMLRSVCSGVSYEDILKTLVYLSGERIGLFLLKFGIFDEDGTLYDIEPSEIKDHLKYKKPVVSPISGELLHNLDDAVLYFTGTQNFSEILKADQP